LKISGYYVEQETPLRNKAGNVVRYALIAFTSPKRPLPREQANGYAAYLKRCGLGGRILEVPTGTIVETWERTTQGKK
jgi:hypothetical protein